MVKRASIKRRKAEQDVAVAGVVTDGPEPDDDGGHYTIRHWIESGVPRRDAPDVDFVDEVYGSLLYHPESGNRQRAGRFRAYVARINDGVEAGWSPFQVLDSHSQGLADIWPILFDARSGWLRESLAERSDVIMQDLLVLDVIEVVATHRGKGLGLAVASRLIDLLAGPGMFTVMWPAPLQFAGGYNGARFSGRQDARFTHAMRMDEFPTNRQHSLRQLREYWGQLGFTRIGRSQLYALSTSEPRPKMEDICDASLF